jgi:quinol monooxygenase YgiN
MMWTLRLKPGKLEETIAAGKAHIAASRLEPGCVSFDFYVNVDGSDSFTSVEEFRDQEALDAHRKTPHFLTFIPLLEANLESVTMEWLDPPDEANPIP